VEDLRGKVDEMVASLRSRTDGAGTGETGTAALAGSDSQAAPPAEI
jgi:hypothetical protein